MKFGKQIREVVERSYPEWQPAFMCYKALKQRIVTTPNATPAPSAAVTPDHFPFFELLTHEVEKVNEFFLDKEEDCIIEHHNLAERVAECLVPGSATREEVNVLRQRLIDLHAELVLLENFSTVNYTGFRKILKKHEKKTGLRLRSAYLVSVITTPFFLSDTARRLVLSTEKYVQQLGNITKFRRGNNSDNNNNHDDQLKRKVEQACASSSANTPSDRVLSAAVSKQKPHRPASITSLSFPTAVRMPRPRARIARESALWSLCAHAAQVGNKSYITPSQQVLDLVDNVTARELGLSNMFVSGVNMPTHYTIAEGATESTQQNYSVGMFVMPQGTKLQLFHLHPPGMSVSRLMLGSALLTTFRSPSQSSTDKSPSEKDEGLQAYSSGDIVEESRRGIATGPWPAVTSFAQNCLVQWEARATCAVFYIAWPNLNQPLQYTLTRLSKGLYSATPAEGKGQFTQISC